MLKPGSTDAPQRAKPRYLPWLLLCVALIVYSSTVVGPSGLTFVALDGATAWREFEGRAFTWVSLGSDQRSDWMGNLLMGVPFGFLLAGALWPRDRAVTGRAAEALAAAAALGLALLFVLAVKFAQLYFPPRTVMLNYVVAQTVGAAVGVAALAYWARALRRPLWLGLLRPRESLRLGLALYSVAWLLFVLMPLDFALSRSDLLALWIRLPEVVVAVPGANRPPAVRCALLAASALATAPLGMWLVLGRQGRNRPVSVAVAAGFAVMVVVLLLSALVISGSPSLISVAVRATGVALGAVAMHWLLRQDPELTLRRLRSMSVWAVLPYFGLLLAVNGVVSLDWRTPAEAARSSNLLGLLPLYDYYIVSKSAAASNIVAHAVMYAPIGLFVWLQFGQARTAAAIAVPVALVVEAARYLRPGLEGDINAIAVAGIAAYSAARLMPAVWRLVRSIAT